MAPVAAAVRTYNLIFAIYEDRWSARWEPLRCHRADLPASSTYPAVNSIVVPLYVFYEANADYLCNPLFIHELGGNQVEIQAAS